MAAQIATSYVVGKERVVASLDDVPFDGPVVVIANELLDNVPVAIAVRTGSGWEERWIGVDGGDLCLVAAPIRDEVADWVERFGGDVPVGGLVEAHVLGDAWFRDVLGRIETGTVCIIDYGDTAEALAPRRSFGTLRTYRSHHLGPDPLAFPGETDITADVNFSSLLAICGELDWEATLQRQEDFLTEYGLRAQLSEFRRQELALARDGDPMDRLRVRSRKNEAETLLHSRGLGDFRVLIARH
jgi:NADH dehydrogenase [ubiquinone] 1 alpha subcomplex assembly factor 7